MRAYRPYIATSIDGFIARSDGSLPARGHAPSIFLLQRTCLVCFLLVFSLPANAQEEFPDAAFFVGTYRLIGKTLDQEEAFLGRVMLRIVDTALVAERTVGDSTISGTWALEYALGEEMRVVRMRFGKGESRLEGTYQWSVDFDNYPRLSGYFYRPAVRTDEPGMEVLFIIPPG
jgi:hypothetical protein